VPLLPAVSQCYMQDTVLGCTRASVSDYNEFDGHSMGYTKGYQQDQKSSDDWNSDAVLRVKQRRSKSLDI
jgi:hypothetical protein